MKNIDLGNVEETTAPSQAKKALTPKKIPLTRRSTPKTDTDRVNDTESISTTVPKSTNKKIQATQNVPSTETTDATDSERAVEKTNPSPKPSGKPPAKARRNTKTPSHTTKILPESQELQPVSSPKKQANKAQEKITDAPAQKKSEQPLPESATATNQAIPKNTRKNNQRKRPQQSTRQSSAMDQPNDANTTDEVSQVQEKPDTPKAIALEAIALEAIALEAIAPKAIALEAIALEAIALEATAPKAIPLEATAPKAIALDTPSIPTQTENTFTTDVEIATASMLTTEEGEAPSPTTRPRRRRGSRKRNGKQATTALNTEQNDSIEPESILVEESTISTPKEAVKKAKGKSKKDSSTTDLEPEETIENIVPRQMLISVLPNEQAEVVIVENGNVTEYYIEMTHQAKIRSNIYKGIVSNIDTNLQAAFINYGHNKNGFLQIDEIHPEYWLQHHEPTKGQKYPLIQKVMKAGQEVMVQVVKEPSGTKGAFLTTWVSLAGRFLVLTPGQEQIGISRKVVDDGERGRLRDLIRGIEPGVGFGAIVRTVSAGTNKTTLQKDLNFLKRLWKDILKKVTTEKAPALIYQEPNLATRAIRDYLSDNINAVWVDDASTMDSIKAMVHLLFPRKTKLVHLYKSASTNIWEHFKVQKQLDQVYSREVVMPSGGRLVFDQTEALMAIDINSGKTSGRNSFETMALRTNTEAAISIAQQLRLRDIGGQIVIDFIEMRDQAHCRSVEKVLRNAMKNDRARHDIGKMSDFGLLQIVRQRIGSSAISISQEPCPCCNGTGLRRSMEWQALHALRDITKQAHQANANAQKETTCIIDMEVGLYLLNQKRQRLLDLEIETGVQVHISLQKGI